MTTIYTIGHGTRTAAELLDTLSSAHIELLVDVRRWPASRRHPQFSRQALERSLEREGIRYEWWGEELGGRRNSDAGRSRHIAWRNKGFRAYADHMDTPQFRSALARLIDAGREARTAIMCAETLWWNCHRRLISDALTFSQIEVVHLIAPGSAQPHKPHPNARVDEEGRPVYDVGVDVELDL